MMSTGPPAHDQKNFVQTSKIFSLYLGIYKKYILEFDLGPVNQNFHFEDWFPGMLYKLHI
jgi:hypothetical protein